MTSNAELETAVSPARDDQVQVLLVEDDDGDAVLVGELLREVGAAVAVSSSALLVIGTYIRVAAVRTSDTQYSRTYHHARLRR